METSKIRTGESTEGAQRFVCMEPVLMLSGVEQPKPRGGQVKRVHEYFGTRSRDKEGYEDDQHR